MDVDAQSPMTISDVIAVYPHCTFCGRGVREDLAYRDSSGNLYHTRECYEFSLAYPALLDRLRQQSTRDDQSGASNSARPERRSGGVG